MNEKQNSRSLSRLLSLSLSLSSDTAGGSIFMALPMHMSCSRLWFSDILRISLLVAGCSGLFCSVLYCFVLAWTSRLSFNKHSFTLSSAVAAGEVTRPHNPRQLQLFVQFSSPCASLESESVMILVWLPKVAATLPLFLSYFRSLSVFCFTLAAAFHTHEFLSGILQFSAFSFQSLTQSSGPESFDVALLLIFSKSK